MRKDIDPQIIQKFEAPHTDPNVDLMAEALFNYNNVRVIWVHLTPSLIKSDTSKKYLAKYKDDLGSYWFSVIKKNGKYIVNSEGRDVYKGKDKAFILDNYEVQLGAYTPKVLQDS